ncbi:MAG: phospholipase D-like domain-containing protein [Candidatus Burarchaeum sp.]|nr:phospholipase D-like domain-containing protein [Candidatus Burarchaeum sp.]MDO8339648.1 phospholipase D-like domain-containing protein [Candidatus Burarchaeum sp.]
MSLRFGLFTVFALFILGILVGAGFIMFIARYSPATTQLPFLSEQQSPPPASCPQVTPIFSPNGEDEVISLISSASSTLDLEVYAFSYELLADELIKAKERGIAVRVLLEPSLSGNNPNLATAETLRDGGVEVRWADPSRTNHAKFLIIDGRRVLVGSHNWSWHAMNTNREASLLVEDSATVREFEDAFEKDWMAAYS